MSSRIALQIRLDKRATSGVTMAGEPGDSSLWWTLPPEIRNIIYKLAYVGDGDFVVKNLLAPAEYEKEQLLEEIDARRSRRSVCGYSLRTPN